MEPPNSGHHWELEVLTPLDLPLCIERLHWLHFVRRFEVFTVTSGRSREEGGGMWPPLPSLIFGNECENDAQANKVSIKEYHGIRMS